MDIRISLVCLILGFYIFLIFNTKVLNYINDHLNNDFSLFLFLHACFSASLSVVICESLQTMSVLSVFLTWLILSELPIIFIYAKLVYRNYVAEKSKKLAEEIEQIINNLKKSVNEYKDYS